MRSAECVKRMLVSDDWAQFISSHINIFRKTLLCL
jgi:hypothetical protein